MIRDCKGDQRMNNYDMSGRIGNWNFTPIKRVKATPMFPKIERETQAGQALRMVKEKQVYSVAMPTMALPKSVTGNPVTVNDNTPRDADGLPIEIGKEYECLPDEEWMGHFGEVAGNKSAARRLVKEVFSGTILDCVIWASGLFWPVRSVRRVKSEPVKDRWAGGRET